MLSQNYCLELLPCNCYHVTVTTQLLLGTATTELVPGTTTM